MSDRLRSDVDALGSGCRDFEASFANLPARYGSAASCVRCGSKVSDRSKLARSDSFPRILSWRQWLGHRRESSDRLDRTRRQTTATERRMTLAADERGSFLICVLSA